MKDENKTRKQLISELVELRQRIAKMDKLENKRKKAEEALRESENRYKRLVEGSPDIVYIYSSKRGALYWSERVRTILGYAPTLLLEHPFIWHDSIHPDDLQAVDQAIAESGQRKAFDLEYRIKNSQGHWHWLHDRSISTRHFGDEILIEGLASDITERKEMEEDLRLQAEIMRNMAEGVILTRVSDGVIVYTNPKFEEIFGYGPGELIGKNISIVNAPTDKIPEDVAAEIQKCLRENNVWQGEVYNIKKDGTPFWCYANVSTFNHHYHGEVWVAVHTDITERKRAEEELQKSEALLIETQSITKVGGWELDVEKGQITWTDEVYRIYGVTQDYNPNDVEQDMQFYAPESIPILKEAFQRALEKGEPYDLELKFIRANGEHIWVRTIGKPVLKDGKVVLITGNFMDITERKKAEDRERLAHEVLDLLNRPESALYKIRDILLLVKKSMGFEAVGIRLQQGDDFPYYETRGFPEDFVHAERYLCAYDEAGKIVRDGKGNPVLECMCGNVLCGRTNAALPFFTEGGSFWTNSTTDLLASTTEEDRQARTRNRCNGEGYESVALIPLRSGSEIIGLLQLNDRRRNLFKPEIIRFCEGLGASIGIALARKRIEAELKRHRDHLEELVENRTHELLKSAEQLNQAKERLINLHGY